MPDELTDARLRLAMASGLGPTLTLRLQQHLGGPIPAAHASVAQLKSIEGIGPKKADAIRRALDDADTQHEHEHIQRLGVQLIAIDDAAYPTLLRHIADPPPLLYVRGELQRHDGLALAMVGSRRCTAYGREQADRLAALSAQAGLTIVSGGAHGIDAAAHRATLRIRGRTLAVLGSGLANPYPKDHADLFNTIADGHGAVLSELPITAPPIAENFPRRNRIISGLSLGVLVVEAANRSGALITARLAAEEHHREVMALPGRVDSPASAGCHRIIRENWATLVTNPADILDALGEAGQTLKAAMNEEAQHAANQQTTEPHTEYATTPAATPPPETHTKADTNPAATPTQADTPDPRHPNLDPETAAVLNAIATDPTDVDTVCRATGLNPGALQSQLMRLQLTGHIERLPGNRVRRKR